MSIFKRQEAPKPEEKPRVVGDGCKKCYNYNNGYCKGKDRCCEANKPMEEPNSN